MSRVRSNFITNRLADGAPTASLGLIISGVTTSTTLNVDDKIVHTGDTNTALRFPAADTITAETSGTERLRITSNGDIVTQGLTNYSFNNDSANTKVFEVTGDGTVGEYGVINISGNQNTDDGTIGIVKFINRENSSSSSGSNAGGRQLGSIEMRTDTDDSNAGDDCGGYFRFITKADGGGNAERLRITSDGNVGVNVTDPKSKLHLPVNADVRIGGQYGGTAQVQNEINYSSGYTGVHWMFESNQSVSWCFDGVMIVNGSGSSSYGSEVVKITIVYSREHGALNSGDTWRNGTSSYNFETLGHDQVGLNPSAGTLSVTEQTDPDGAGSTRSLLKLSWSASGQSVGVTSRLIGNLHWSAAATPGGVEIQDKDGNVKWNSHP